MDVVVMRRLLSQEELAALERFHPGESIVQHETAPASAAEHLANCQQFDAKLAFLPHEQPIPVPAMKAGVRHLLLKDGQLLELVSVVPQFKPYTP